MRYGYWLPVFGGWLRNVEDERMEASWAYVRRLARRSEELGYDLTLIAELLLNDIKGIDAPSLDAWSTAAALAAVTDRLELMVAVRPSCRRMICNHAWSMNFQNCRVSQVGTMRVRLANPVRSHWQSMKAISRALLAMTLRCRQSARC